MGSSRSCELLVAKAASFQILSDKLPFFFFFDVSQTLRKLLLAHYVLYGLRVQYLAYAKQLRSRVCNNIYC